MRQCRQCLLYENEHQWQCSKDLQLSHKCLIQLVMGYGLYKLMQKAPFISFCHCCFYHFTSKIAKMREDMENCTSNLGGPRHGPFTLCHFIRQNTVSVGANLMANEAGKIIILWVQEKKWKNLLNTVLSQAKVHHLWLLFYKLIWFLFPCSKKISSKKL